MDVLSVVLVFACRLALNAKQSVELSWSAPRTTLAETMKSTIQTLCLDVGGGGVFCVAKRREAVRVHRAISLHETEGRRLCMPRNVS